MTISKSKLKAKMLGVFREIEKTGEEIIVTDNRKPVLKIVPLTKKKTFDEVFADVQGKLKYTEEIFKSTEDEWGDLK
ncbi:MAG: prevent-host-death protein [Planctomycetes bacterium]|nr:prevent-host-death protein [Planctomycetota bacterium]